MPGGGWGGNRLRSVPFTTTTPPTPHPPLPVRDLARGAPVRASPPPPPPECPVPSTPVPVFGDSPVPRHVPPGPDPRCLGVRDTPVPPAGWPRCTAPGPHSSRPRARRAPVLRTLRFPVSVPPAPLIGPRPPGADVRVAPVPTRIPPPSRGRPGPAARSLPRYAGPPGPGRKEPRSGMRSRRASCPVGCAGPPGPDVRTPPTRGLSAQPPHCDPGAPTPRLRLLGTVPGAAGRGSGAGGALRRGTDLCCRSRGRPSWNGGWGGARLHRASRNQSRSRAEPCRAAAR